MATYLWSTLSADQVIVFDPLVDELIFDSGITSYTQLWGYDWTNTSSYYTDSTGKTVTFNGLGIYNMSPLNVQFQGSDARFLVGDLTAGTTDDDLANEILGTTGDDWIYGGGGDDTLTGGDGNDQIFAATNGSGNDLVDGGNGIDWYAAGTTATFGMTVNLMTGVAYTTDGEVDTLINIENVRGTMHDDVLIGDNGDNVLRGRAGQDILVGMGGSDLVTYYEGNASIGVHVDLSSGVTSEDGFGTSDILAGIENVSGGKFDDFIMGNADNNVLRGNAGNDVINGGDGPDTLLGDDGNDTLMGGNGADTLVGGTGNDVLNGGTGFDTAAYWSETAGVKVRLNTTAQQDTGAAGLDTLTFIENLVGSDFNDQLTGSVLSNHLDGGIGNDTLNGLAGNDSLVGGAGNDVVNGGAGDDTMNGDTGVDTASYQGAASGVTVSLATTAAQNTGGAGTDILIGFERLTGSSYADTLTGNNGVNQLKGGLGADTLTGGNGADQFMYGNITESAAGSAFDTITDFTTAQNDKINLLLIDANTGLAGNQAFSFIGSAAFSAAGQVRFENGMVYANVNADLGADLQIELTGVTNLTSANFVL